MEVQYTFAQLAVPHALFMHKVTEYLENNSYVRVLCIDLSKAFDVMDHAILIPKLIAFEHPSNIIYWIISFLSDRNQICIIKLDISNLAHINMNIIQGSCVVPTLCHDGK